MTVNAAAPWATDASVSPDTFGHKAAKLGALLGQSPSAKVLFIGSMSQSWDQDFQSHFPTLTQVTNGRQLDDVLRNTSRHDLIIIAPSSLSKTMVTFRRFRRLRQALTRSGSLFAIVQNRFDLAAFLRHPQRIMAGAGVSLLGFRWWLRRAGFERSAEFLAMPNLSSVEEFVLSGSRELALPSRIPPAVALAHRLGFLPFVHDAAAYIASGKDAGPQILLGRLTRELRDLGYSLEELELQRFDLRARGALILVLKARNSGERFVCRVTTDAATDRIVGRNAEWLALMAGTPDISPEVKSALPAPLGVVTLPDARAYIERAIPGKIAWKLGASPRMDLALRRDLCNFITALGRDTAREVSVDKSVFQELVEPPVPQVVNGSVAVAYRALLDGLSAKVLGARRVIVWAHGDFGYGNAIADPQTGKLNGIIDWDQARTDLAGVDLLNFLVQRERSLNGSSLLAALEMVGRSFILDGWAGLDSQIGYETYFNAPAETRSELVAWTSLRFAQRTMTYPSLFATVRDEINIVLKWATAILE